jgi:hypothetical protein
MTYQVICFLGFSVQIHQNTSAATSSHFSHHRWCDPSAPADLGADFPSPVTQPATSTRIASIFPTPERVHETIQLDIDSSPSPAAPLPGLSTFHHHVATKGTDRPGQSPPEFLPQQTFIVDGSSTSLMCMAYPPSPLVSVGPNPSVFRQNTQSVSSPKYSSPSPCPLSKLEC